MLLPNQKHLFSIESGVSYLNCAAYSPTLKSSVQKGIEGIHLKANTPHKIASKDHYSGSERVRNLFTKLVNIADNQSVVIIGGVSYGMAVVANNLHLLPNISSKKHIIQIQDEFPNNIYAFERVASQLNLSYKTIEKPDAMEERGKIWNERILNAIDAETAMIVMPHIHWIYGVKFDLEAISKRCKEVGALLVVDGSQSVGALGFDVQKIQPDALVVAGYKWLFGAYGIGLAYFGEFFDDGIPIEESWMNRMGADNFARLIEYERAYQPRALKYNVGEFSHFIEMGMLEDSLTQILEWGVENIQNYCSSISENAISELNSLGFLIEEKAYRGNHLLGISLPNSIDNQKLTEKLTEKKIIISNRGVAIRVSPHVYNSEEEMMALVEVLKGNL